MSDKKSQEIIFKNNSEVIYQNIKYKTGTIRNLESIILNYFIYSTFSWGGEGGGGGSLGAQKVPLSDLKRVKV